LTRSFGRPEPLERTSLVVLKLPASEVRLSDGTSIGAPPFSLRRNPFSIEVLWCKHAEQHKKDALRSIFEKLAAKFEGLLVDSIIWVVRFICF
jgi:hypothetical protein